MKTLPNKDGRLTSIGLEIFRRVHGDELDSLLVLNTSYDQRRIERMHLTAAIPLLAMSTFEYKNSFERLNWKSQAKKWSTYGLDNSSSTELGDKFLGRRGNEIVPLLAELSTKTTTV